MKVIRIIALFIAFCLALPVSAFKPRTKEAINSTNQQRKTIEEREKLDAAKHLAEQQGLHTHKVSLEKITPQAVPAQQATPQLVQQAVPAPAPQLVQQAVPQAAPQLVQQASQQAAPQAQGASNKSWIGKDSYYADWRNAPLINGLPKSFPFNLFNLTNQLYVNIGASLGHSGLCSLSTSYSALSSSIANGMESIPFGAKIIGTSGVSVGVQSGFIGLQAVEQMAAGESMEEIGINTLRSALLMIPPFIPVVGPAYVYCSNLPVKILGGIASFGFNNWKLALGTIGLGTAYYLYQASQNEEDEVVEN